MPILDLALDLRRHEEVWGSARLGRTVLHGCFVHVVAAATVLGAIAAVSSQYGLTCVLADIPLREALVASDMSSFAGPAAVAGLGVAFARRATTGRHLDSVRMLVVLYRS